MGMPRITNVGPERARKRTLGEREGRSYKHRIDLWMSLEAALLLSSPILEILKRCSEGGSIVSGVVAHL